LEKDFLTDVDIKMIFSHTRPAPAKSGVGIGVPESAERITALSGFFMRWARSLSHYGGACRGGEIRAGSLLPVTPTLYVSPPHWLASEVVIT